jgi:hypothetical protein
LQDIVNEHIEKYLPGKEPIGLLIPALKGIIASTAKQHDEWDDLPNRNTCMTLKCAVAAHVTNPDMDCIKLYC